MKSKERQVIITFQTTTQAIKAEKYCKEKNIFGRLIPVPERITAGCGLAWKTAVSEKEAIRHAFAEGGITYEAMTELEI